MTSAGMPSRPGALSLRGLSELFQAGHLVQRGVWDGVLPAVKVWVMFYLSVHLLVRFSWPGFSVVLVGHSYGSGRAFGFQHGGQLTFIGAFPYFLPGTEKMIQWMVLRSCCSHLCSAFPFGGLVSKALANPLVRCSTMPGYLVLVVGLPSAWLGAPWAGSGSCSIPGRNRCRSQHCGKSGWREHFSAASIASGFGPDGTIVWSGGVVRETLCASLVRR